MGAIEEIKGFQARGWEARQSVWVYRGVLVTARIVFDVLLRPYRALGAENVPSGGVFIVANHTSALDPFVIGQAVRHRAVYGPARSSYFRVPGLGWLMSRLGSFPLMPGSRDVTPIRAMFDLYRQGRLIYIFPEATRTLTGQLGPFEPSLTRMLMKLEATVVAAGLAGAGEALPPGKLFFVRRGPVVVSFSPPFTVSRRAYGGLSESAVEAATQDLFVRVSAEVEKARAERQRLMEKSSERRATVG